MNLGFTETQMFMQIREEFFAGDKSYSDLQQFLLANPEAGKLIQGCGGVRKIRWPDPRRGKGKRGGLRVIYLHVTEAQMILFLYVYDKDESDDLTPDQRKVLAQIAGDYRRTALRKK